MNEYNASVQQNLEWRGKLHKILDESDSATIFDWDEGAFAPVHKVMEEANDDTEILCRCAVILCRYFPGLLFAERAYERVLTLDPKNVTALKNLSWMAVSHGDYERAAVYGERLIEIAGEQTAENYFIAARAHRLRGDIERARALFREIINQLPTDSPQLALREDTIMKAVAAQLAGWEDEADVAIKDICEASIDGCYLRDIDYYPNSIEAQLGRLRSITEGKDICLYGAGPSIEKIADKKSVLSQDNFVHFIINTFSIIEDEILKPAGARLSLACFSHPTVLFGANDRLEEFLRRDYPTMAILSNFVIDHCLDRPECSYLLEHGDWIFRFRTTNKLPPTPRDPLSFPNINTLLLALCTAVLGRPRRIFLFGFDQRVIEDDGDKSSSVYFKEFDDRYPAHDRTDEARRQHISDWVKWDAIQVNELSGVSLRMLAQMFGVDLPIIYNVCPKSGLDRFPKIDIAQFLDLVTKG